MKEGSGPDGPDQQPVPREIAPSAAAPDQLQASASLAHTDNTGFVSAAQSHLDMALVGPSSGCRSGADSDTLPAGAVVYDSGWEECSGISLRVAFTAGPASEHLRAWVRELMLRPIQNGRTGAGS